MEPEEKVPEEKASREKVPEEKVPEEKVPEEKAYQIEGMHCASCVTGLEKALQALRGVHHARIHLLDKKLFLSYTSSVCSFSVLADTVKKLGYALKPELASDKAAPVRSAPASLPPQLLVALAGNLGVLGIGKLWSAPYAPYVVWGMASMVLVYSGWRFFDQAWKGLRYGTFNMYTLITMGVATAYISSTYVILFEGKNENLYFDSALMIITFVWLGRYLEEKAKHACQHSIEKLLTQRPQYVLRIEPDRTVLVSMKTVQRGDALVVRTGEYVPVDGRLLSREAYVEEGTFTGEALPAHKKTGDRLFEGSLNRGAALEMRALSIGESTLRAQILRSVKQAQTHKIPLQRKADAIARVLVPVTLGIALLSFLAWGLWGGTWGAAIWPAVSVLIIACPCAIGLAIPLALSLGIGRAAQKGFLVQKPENIANLLRIDTVLFDKTGTLTQGKPTVHTYSITQAERTYVPLIRTLALHSMHPLSRSIATGLPKPSAPDHKSLAQPPLWTDLHDQAGKGVEGKHQGHRYRLGSRAWLAAHSTAFPDTLQAFAKQHDGMHVWFAKKDTALAVFVLRDELRPEAATMTKALQAQGLSLALLSGDHPTSTRSIAQALGIAEAQGACLPADKQAWVEKKQVLGHKVLVVGDGINDATAMAVADMAIAVSDGASVTLSHADVVALPRALSQLDALWTWTKKLRQGVQRNLLYAFMYNLLAIPIAAGVLYPFGGPMLHPVGASVAMSLSSISVVLSSLWMGRRM